MKYIDRSNFRMLYMLVHQPRFIRALWYTLHTQQNSVGFSSPLTLITKGIQIGIQIESSFLFDLFYFKKQFGNYSGP